MIHVLSLSRLRIRQLTTPPRLLGVAWAGTAAVLEIAGRKSPSDLLDALGVAALIAMGSATYFVHRANRLEVIDWLVRSLRSLGRSFRRHTLRVGVDLRGTPPLAPGFPPILTGAVVLLVAVTGVLGATRGLFPTGARSVLLHGSATVYFAMLTVLWGLLLAATLFLLVFTGACLHNWIINAPGLRHARRGAVEATVMVAAFVALVAIGILLPTWVALASVGVTLLAALVAVAAPGAPGLLLVWERQGGGPISATQWYRVVACVAILAATGLGILVLVAIGDRLGVPGGSTMPLTTFLGGAVAWSGAAAYAVWAWSFPLKTFVHRFRDPAKPLAIRVEMLGSRLADRDSLERLRAAGFEVRFAAASGEHSAGVSVELDERALRPEDPGHHELPVSGRITIHPDDLHHPDVQDAIRHVHEVRCRRELLRGLDDLFRFAAERRFEQGHGFWIAPHLWFVTHMTRDTSEDDSWSVGPPYHRLLDRSARHHLHRILHALEIDLLFVEDGVRFDHLRLVFRALFDAYDFFGGGRAEERHFDGLPGVRVVIHEFTMERSFTESGYPEVNYEEIGRARILHVFRDRGGPDDRADVPIDSDLVGEPALV